MEKKNSQGDSPVLTGGGARKELKPEGGLEAREKGVKEGKGKGGKEPPYYWLPLKHGLKNQGARLVGDRERKEGERSESKGARTEEKKRVCRGDGEGHWHALIPAIDFKN